MDSMFLANMMIFADTLNMQNQTYLNQVIHDELTSSRSTSLYVPMSMSEQNIEMYQSNRWYSDQHLGFNSSLEMDTPSQVDDFELISGRNGQSYAKCTSSSYNEDVLIVVLNLNRPKTSQIPKIRENIKTLLNTHKTQKECYMVIYGVCGDSILSEVTKDWKECCISKQDSKQDNKQDETFKAPPIYMRIRS